MTSDAKQTVTFLLLLQNSRYREEVLDLSSRNLQLSNDNAELTARLRGDQESVRMLQERLATVSKEQEEEGASVSNSTSLFTFFLLLLSFFSICRGSGRIKDGVFCLVRLRCCVSGAAAAGCSSAAGEREDAAAGGLDAGDTVTGERAQLLQGEGTNTPTSSYRSMRRCADGR